jgi:GGDEF domain-containing protein
MSESTQPAEPDKRSYEPHTSSYLEHQVRSLTERIVQLKGELAQALARVAALTTTDETTGLLTWHAFTDRANAEIARAARYHREIGLVLLAPTQPEVGIHRLAEICRAQHRECDIAGLTERGEIVLLLPETSFQGALVMGQRVRARAAKGCDPPSMGCASWPQHGRTLTALIATARHGPSAL